jgi:Rrf2 family protein
MLRLSKKVDYGLILLSELHGGAMPQAATGLLDGSATSAREMAGRHQLPLPMVANILKALTGAGILASTRGAQGGYTLARPASTISLADIVRALEGPLSLTDCTDAETHCEYQPGCPTHDPIQRIHRRFELFMSGYMLDEIFGCPTPRPFEFTLRPQAEKGRTP